MNPRSPEELAAEVDLQSHTVRELVAGLSDEALFARPDPDHWSVGEHVEHLSLTNRVYLDTLSKGVADARARGLRSDGPFGGTWRGERFIKSLEPPPGFRIRTFKRLEPPPELAREAVLEGFQQTQDRVAATMREAQGLDVGALPIRSPFLWLLKMSLHQGFRTVVAHNQRHLWHIDRIVS